MSEPWHLPIPPAATVRDNWRTLPLARMTKAEQALYREEVAAEVARKRFPVARCEITISCVSTVETAQDVASSQHLW